METYNYVASETGDDSRENEHVPVSVFFFLLDMALLTQLGMYGEASAVSSLMSLVITYFCGYFSP